MPAFRVLPVAFVACSTSFALARASAQDVGAPVTEVRMPEATRARDSHDAAVLSRAIEVRRACRDSTSVDVFAYLSSGMLIAGGVGLAVWGLTTPQPGRPLGMSFVTGLGPGLALGGIGIPFARGVIREVDPLSSACERAMTSGADMLDIDVAARLLTHHGAPMGPLVPLLLGGATVGVGVGMAVAFALGSGELVQLFGGLSAAAITGWFILPPTPVRIAAMRFRAGDYRAGPYSLAIAPTLLEPGLSVAGLF